MIFHKNELPCIRIKISSIVFLFHVLIILFIFSIFFFLKDISQPKIKRNILKPSTSIK